MKAVVKYYESGYASAEVPEIVDLREEITCSSIDDLIEYAKRTELPAAAEYAHIYVGEEPVIAIIHDGIRDLVHDEWIGDEPEE